MVEDILSSGTPFTPRFACSSSSEVSALTFDGLELGLRPVLRVGHFSSLLLPAGVHLAFGDYVSGSVRLEITRPVSLVASRLGVWCTPFWTPAVPKFHARMSVVADSSF